MRVYLVIALMILCLAAQNGWAGEKVAPKPFPRFSKDVDPDDYIRSLPPLSLTEGRQFALCRDLYAVLKEPENRHIYKTDPQHTADTQLFFSKKYKKFKHVTWHPFAREDLPKYFKKIPESLLAYEKDHVPFNLFWGKADLDHNGDADTLVKILLNQDIIGTPAYSSKVFVSDVTDPDLENTDGGMNIFNERRANTVIYYKGLAYVVSRSSGFGLVIEEYTAPRSDQPSVIIYRHLCSFLPITN